MTGKRAENVLEIRAYIKGRSLLGIKAADIHREVCDIYGRAKCLTGLFVGGWLNLMLDSSKWKMLLAQVVLQQLRPKVT